MTKFRSEGAASSDSPVELRKELPLLVRSGSHGNRGTRSLTEGAEVAVAGVAVV
jgi:hypothetical protein